MFLLLCQVWQGMICLPPWQVGGPERKYHVVITAAGTAVHWQSRVAYYWYKKVQKQCEVGRWVWVGISILMRSQTNALRVPLPLWERMSGPQPAHAW